MDFSWGQRKPPSGTPLNTNHHLFRGLVGYWVFNEGNFLPNNLISGRRLTQGGTPAIGAGYWGECLVCDGATSTKVVSEVATAFGDFSCVAWFQKTGSAASFERVVDKDYASGFWLGREGTNANTWGGGVAQGGPPYGQYITLTDGQPHQIASVRLGTTHWIWGDGGTKEVTATVTGSALSASAVAIGGDNDFSAGDGPLTGKVFQVLVWNRAISKADVAALYAEPFLLFSDQDDDVYLTDVTSSGVTISATADEITFVSPAATVTGNADIAATADDIGLTSPAATVTGGATVAPAAAVITFNSPAATVTGGVTLSPDSAVITFVSTVATVGSDITIAATTAAITFVSSAATATGGAALSPATATITLSPPAATAVGGAVLSPSAGVITLTSPAGTALGGFAYASSAGTILFVSPAATLITDLNPGGSGGNLQQQSRFSISIGIHW